MKEHSEKPAKVNLTNIKLGSFEVNLAIADSFDKNPLWGDHIIVKGSFFTK
jgi:hypothetical protein